ncbi:hypothetical protein PHLGIDRAFT_22785 [Phlebiopsis gigantea 11061_1 CR5-6]|uniref:U4/U6 snRNA-associated-splicing factor PRP24 n=1 Tax=Phlebiopsis gigantea (strain 11061_1 CR5-6) TaxID=745531 RepID=A0A0C3S2U4_PHLG1|nr:hypothetical protein PHLGIDRAFT_22785 [Phlebiopsis gigantea 11061_1 CR5-6]
MDQANALEALVGAITLLNDNPYDIALHAQHVRLARETGMDDQLESALDMVTTFYASGDHIWLPLVELKIKGTDVGTTQGIKDVLAMFERAEADYLSIPLLQKHIKFLLERYEHMKEQESRPADVDELLTVEWILEEMGKVTSRGSGHLTKSRELWDLQRDFALEELAEATGEQQQKLAARIEPILFNRLKQPHSNNDDTLQAYSSFTTNYKPADQYEHLLVQASKERAQALKAYQRREELETALAQSGYSLEGYAYYLASEKRTKKPDFFVLYALYERAITEADKRRFEGDSNAESALRTFWIGYLDTLRQNDADEDLQLLVYKRATRSVPGSGEIWARYIRLLERAEQGDEIESFYSNTLAIHPIKSDPEQIVPVVLAKASFERRKIEGTQMATEDAFDKVIETLMEGIGKVHAARKTGDSQLRLEKYFSSLCTDVVNLVEHAVVMWEDATKFYKSSYLAWTAYTDVLIKQRLNADARKAFKDVANKNLDWPEAVWDAWVSFEQVHGSLEELEECFDRVERARNQVNARRTKEAERAARVLIQTTIEEQAASAPVTEATISTIVPEAAAIQDVVMDAEPQPSRVKSSGKRKAEDELVPEETKKAHVESSPVPLKRDRENCTVFVANIPTRTSEDDLRALFKDCGHIREIKLTPMPNSLVATVEFMERNSVPAALTKDKKRVHGEEIAVHLAWQSTLYVTNFPESADDKFIRDLFGKYGVLFDIRWPSKKFKSTRRFCYVQYATPSAAKAALELHKQELEPGRAISVLISNPERKKERTDIDANDRELYVAGLSRTVKKEDLKKLFATYGAVKDIRMATDEKGQPKGFAFVEYEQEKDALAALVANNYELKNRRIAVTVADTRVKNSKNLPPGRRRPEEVRIRSIRVRGLPTGTQEGLLQQTLEKIANVQRVEVFVDRNEAIAELESPAEAGKLLLYPSPVIFNGNTLRFSEESLETLNSNRPAGPPAAGGGLFIPRSAASRPRAGLGSKKVQNLSVSAASGPSSSAPTASSQPAPAGPAKGQDDFRKMLG